MYDKFSSFLKTQDGVPQTLVELQKQALIKLVTTDGQDPDNIGFQRWRNAFYVAGETAALLNFIYLLDEFWLHASEAIQGHLMVVLYPHTSESTSTRAGAWCFTRNTPCTSATLVSP